MKVKDHYLTGVFFLDIPSESRHWIGTINLVKGETVYNEKLFSKGDIEYRTWDSYKSKLAACVQEGMKNIPQLRSSRILYLGASTGTTVSHLSDIMGSSSGEIIALEFSIKAARRLIQLANNRTNIIPLVADARKPGEYATSVGTVDFIFQDISQVNQTQIFIDNVNAFLKKDCKAIYIVKAASIDTTRSASDVTKEQVDLLEKEGYTILEVLDISKYEKEHRAIIISK